MGLIHERNNVEMGRKVGGFNGIVRRVQDILVYRFFLERNRITANSRNLSNDIMAIYCAAAPVGSRMTTRIRAGLALRPNVIENNEMRATTFITSPNCDRGVSVQLASLARQGTRPG